MDKPYDIFISYASEDEAYATELVKSLEFHGFKVWFAPLTSPIGEKVLDVINAGMIASKYGLMILSSHYMAKHWTNHELNYLYRQHIEGDKRLFPILHGVTAERMEKWRPGLSEIIVLNSSEKISTIVGKIAKVISQNAPIRGVAPRYENPQWRFLKGRGELLVNDKNGGAFNIFEAAEFPESFFPLYIFNRQYSKREIMIEVAEVLYYQTYDSVRLSKDQKERLERLCISFGFNIRADGFDPETIY